MEQNRTGKYIKYAIGEIVLVVFGILIALSINNWNEQRKYKNLEISMLTEIQASLKESLGEINHMIERNGNLVEDYTILLNHIDNNLPYNESLDSYFSKLSHWASPFFNYSAYETLKTLGAELISNDSLKNRIIRMYDRELEFLVSDYDKAEWNYSSSVVDPFLSKHIERDVNSFKAFPNNYTALMHNAEFKNILTNLIVMRKQGINECHELKITLENLIKDISTEIETLN